MLVHLFKFVLLFLIMGALANIPFGWYINLAILLAGLWCLTA